MKEERIKYIENYISEHELCSLDHLCDVFEISKTTLRRDINILEKMGNIRKVYGGVAINKSNQTSTVPFMQREINFHDEKIHIGKMASTYIRDGETIYVDSGTTTLQISHYIKDKSITIVTNNLNLINECVDCSNINIISVGGELSRITKSFTGDLAVNTLSSLNISKSFIAATGISIEAGFSNSLPLETAIKKVAINKSKSVYVMADHTKWGIVSLMTFAKLSAATGIITDLAPPRKYIEYCKTNNIQIIC
ncbi:MAG: DeoR/GlpR transcriptional regulator [Firmicutes bacterium HGW-Firmicutes-7]|nr:MAG: DeoR/GlpR transcriptional regulator [Firmicutes bacterium HGW-Firmicutes-7]